MEVRPIDANALFDAMRDKEFQTFCPLDEVDDVIVSAPTLDYAPVRHGEWKRTEVARGVEMHTLYVCSECNDYHGFREDPGQHTFCSNYLYCRTCGAKMYGGKKDG